MVLISGVFVEMPVGSARFFGTRTFIFSQLSILQIVASIIKSCLSGGCPVDKICRTAFKGVLQMISSCLAIPPIVYNSFSYSIQSQPLLFYSGKCFIS